MAIKRFENEMRVVVSVGDLAGKTGTVHRLRKADGGAWVRMDEALAPDIQRFPSDDPRANDLVLYPDEVNQVRSA